GSSASRTAPAAIPISGLPSSSTSRDSVFGSTAGWFADPHGLRVVAYLAVGATVLPYLIWIRGIASTAPALATTLTLTEPLTATLLGLLLLDETVTPLASTGAGLIALGMLLTVTEAARLSRRSG
ncbi:EamA family transporter, partial [Micromonospora sp. NPDC049679]|uniref:EamA family transporter n=1 Tax=Micromonospora sp. NPDC049679 TaxID=3155920 RepID=UPI0033D4A5E0